MAGMISMGIEQFLESAFLKILNMSMTASYIIVAVIIARFLLKKAPKKYSYALWAAAGFRLVCPVSFKSVFSLLAIKPLAMPVEETAAGLPASQIVHIPDDIGFMAQPEIHTGLDAVNAVVNPALPAPTTELASVNPIQIWTILGAYVWALGIVVLLCVSAVSLVKLHRSLCTATLLEGNVWQSENVSSPFIVGFFRPKIFIPYGLAEPGLSYVLAHERAHIKRLDHAVRTLSYLVLCLHWFNPLVWLAFYLMGRDMELSCDEKVLSHMADKAEYSETLLSFAAPRRFPTPTPLAFGESGVSQRIKNALKWHKPKFWVSIIALVCCLAVILACAANPTDDNDGGVWEMRGTWVPVDCVYLSPVYSYFPFGGDNGLIYSINEDGIRVDSHEGGDFLYGYGAVWGWQDFPYSDEEWQEMFLLYENTFTAPISQLYDELLYQPLIGNRTDRVFVEGESEVDAFLMLCDGEMWFVSTNKDSKGQKLISSIYVLQKQEELGMASFAYPDGTSNEPGMEISFSVPFETVSVTTSGGCVWAFADGDTVGGADTGAEVPAGSSLFWCPLQNEHERPEAYNLSKSALLRLKVDYGSATQNFSIYVSYDDGIYTLRPVGLGVELNQIDEKSARLSLDSACAQPKANVAEIPAASPWELLAGLEREKISGIMIDGDPAAVGNTKDPMAVADAVAAALNKVDSTEVRAGRGMPNRYAIGFNYDNDASSFTLGYCGDFVELRLQGEAKEKYPVSGGPVWEIHNAALTELLSSLIRPVLTSFEASVSQDNPAGITARFDLAEYDKVEVLDYFRCFPDETGASSGGSATGNPLAETWWPDEMLTERGRTLAESGGILVTVRKGGGYAQGQLVFEGTATEKDAGGLVRGAEYKVYLEGPFNHALSEDGTEVTLSLDEDWLKPTPAYMLSSLKPSDVTGFELSGQLDGRIINAGIRDREIVDALSALDPGELEIVHSSAFFTEECRAVLHTESGAIILSYGNGETRFDFEGDYSGFAEIVGTWSTKDEALCGLFYEISVSKANALSYVYDVSENPSLRFDFGEYEYLELTYEGGNMLYSADGEGWGDFSSSRLFRDGEEIHWTPMEPVDDENVLAKRVDSAWVVVGVTRDGVTYGGTIYIEGKDGVYTVSTGESEWPKLRQGEDGCAVVTFD